MFGDMYSGGPDDYDDYDDYVPAEDDYRQQFPEDYTDEMSAFLDEGDMSGEDGNVEVDDFDDADDYDADYYDNLFDQV